MRMIFFTLMLLAMPAPTLGANDAPSLFERIKAANKNISVIETRFEQSSKLALFNEPLTVSGVLTLQKPQNLRWEYTHPSSSGFILNKNGGLQWNNTSKNSSIARSKLSPALRVMASQMLLWLNIDEKVLRRDFHIQVEDAKTPSIQLQPKNKTMAKFIKNIVIVLPASLQGIKTITVTEANDSVITLAFAKPTLNPELLPTTFQKP